MPRFKFSSSSTTSIPGIAYAPLFVNYFSSSLRPRACLKKAFRELRVPVCGRFYPNKGGVAGYGNRMRVKYTAKWGLQIAEMIFQTRSRSLPLSILIFLHFILP
ncbi:DUF6783 domain-containing protein [Blautia sp.]